VTSAPLLVRAAQARIKAASSRHAFGIGAPIALGLVVALVFFLPARAGVSGLGAAGRPHFLVAVGLLAWLLQLHPRFRTGKLPGLSVLVLVYVGWVTVAWAAGYGRGLTVAESNGSDRSLIATFAYLGIVLVTSTGLRTARQIDSVLKIIVVGATFSAVVGWIQFWVGFDVAPWLMLPGLQDIQPIIAISERGSANFARVAGTAGHFIEFGVVTAMLTPLAIHYARARPKRQRRLAWTSVVLIAGAVPFSLSRSAIVALALAAIVMLLGWPNRDRWNAIGAMILAVPVYMVIKPGLLGTLKSLFVNAANDPSVTVERPVIGRGPGTFNPEQYILLDNQWLLSLIETGWVGVALLALVLVATIRTLMTVRRRSLYVGDTTQADLALSLLAIIVTLAVTATLFDEFFFTTATTLLWLTVGVTSALFEHQRRQLAELGITPLRASGRIRGLADIARGRPVDLSKSAWI
jgi:hypothetical protein